MSVDLTAAREQARVLRLLGTTGPKTRSLDYLAAAKTIEKLVADIEAMADLGQVPLREQWGARHAQGMVERSSRREAEAFVEDSRRSDEHRAYHARGRQHLIRRFVTDWEDVS